MHSAHCTQPSFMYRLLLSSCGAEAVLLNLDLEASALAISLFAYHNQKGQNRIKFS